MITGSIQPSSLASIYHITEIDKRAVGMNITACRGGWVVIVVRGTTAHFSVYNGGGAGEYISWGVTYFPQRDKWNNFSGIFHDQLSQLPARIQPSQRPVSS